MAMNSLVWRPVYCGQMKEIMQMAAARWHKWMARVGLTEEILRKINPKVKIPGLLNYVGWSEWGRSGWEFTSKWWSWQRRSGETHWSSLKGIVITTKGGKKQTVLRAAFPSDPYEFARLVVNIAQRDDVVTIEPAHFTPDELRSPPISDKAAFVAWAFPPPAPPKQPEPSIPPTTGSSGNGGPRTGSSGLGGGTGTGVASGGSGSSSSSAAAPVAAVNGRLIVLVGLAAIGALLLLRR